MQAKSLLLAGGALLAATSGALASGFQIGLSGQKNIGMGGTGTGLYLDQAAQFYNPGAFAFVQGNAIQGGLNMALPRISFRSEGGGPQETLQNKSVFPFNGYIGFGPKEGKWKLGLAAYTPFGSELHYGSWTGRYALTDINLRAVYTQLTASYAITPQLAIGAGLVWLAYGDVDLQRDVPVQSQAGGTFHAQLTGKADHKFGYNVGLMFKPSDKLSIGASYRSRVDAHIGSGSIALTNQPTSVASSFSATSFSATLPLPDVYSLGVGVRPTDKLTLAVDASVTNWSHYQSLDFAYSGGVLGGATASSSVRRYKAAPTVRLGGQYKITNGLTVRGGAFYDWSCVHDGYVTPETPDASRVGLTAGFTYEFAERFGIDGSFLFEDFRQRSQSQADLVANGTTDRVAGTYKTTISVPGIGLYVKF